MYRSNNGVGSRTSRYIHSIPSMCIHFSARGTLLPKKSMIAPLQTINEGMPAADWIACATHSCLACPYRGRSSPAVCHGKTQVEIIVTKAVRVRQRPQLRARTARERQVGCSSLPHSGSARTQIFGTTIFYNSVNWFSEGDNL